MKKFLSTLVATTLALVIFADFAATPRVCEEIKAENNT